MVRGDSPSSWAPPLGEAVAAGVTFEPPSLRVEGLSVVAPAAVGDPLAFGLAVRTAPGVGDALRGVDRGDALAVCADVGATPASTRPRIAPIKSNVFITDRDQGPDST